MDGDKIEYKFFKFLKYSILALMPILNIYDGISFIGLGTLLLLGIMIVDIFIRRGCFDINTNLLIIMLFFTVLNLAIGITNANVISITGYLHNSIQLGITAVICAYFVKSTIVNMGIFYKYLKVIALVSSLFLFVQFYFYMKGIIVYGFIPYMSMDSIKGIITSISYGRPNSFFLEPAHFAIYVLPVYAISLYKKDYIISIILLLALIFSTSSTGIVIGIIVTIIFIVKKDTIPIIIKWILLLIGIMVIVLFIPFIAQSSILKKISFISLIENIRVFGTLKYFKYFNAKELLTGVGINQISSYLKIYANVNVTNYANAIFFSFLSFGVLGGTVWTTYVVSLFKLNKNKILYLVFILVCFSDQILFNRNLIYLLLILHIFSNTNEVFSIEEGSKYN